MKTGEVKGNWIQSCCSGICCFETTSQCMQAACPDPILHCHGYSPGLVNQKKCTIPNQMPEASAVMNSTKALYNPSLVSKGGKEIGKNILYKPIDCASQWSLVGLTCLRKSMFPFFVKVETTPTRHLSWAAESVAKPKMTTWAHSNTGQMVTTEWRRRKEENVLGHKYT